MPNHEDLTGALKALTDDAIDACIAAKEATDFRFPLLLLRGPDEKSMTVLVDDTENATERAVVRGREQVKSRAPSLDAYVLAYDGLVKAKDGRDLEAFILECGERGQSEAFVFFQRYKRADDGTLVLVFGSSGFLRRTEQLLT